MKNIRIPVLILNINHSYVLSILLAFLAYSVGLSQPSNNIIIRGIRASLEHDYQKSLSIFQQLSDEFPDSPVGPFFKASVLQSKMMDFESTDWEEEFFDQLAETEKRAKRSLKKNPQNSTARYYRGAALAYKGFYLSRQKKYYLGIRAAIVAIEELQKVVAVDSQMYDAYLGIGNYKYWRSRLTQQFNWLPFFSDQREEGIKMILMSFEKGLFARWAATSHLAWIYIDQGEPEIALKYVELGLSEFPQSRFFLWPAADAHKKAGHYSKARDLYKTILNSVLAESFNNHYNEILLYLKIAQCSFELGEMDYARRQCEKALTITGDAQVRDRVKAKRKRIAKLLRKIKKSQETLQAN